MTKPKKYKKAASGSRSGREAVSSDSDNQSSGGTGDGNFTLKWQTEIQITIEISDGALTGLSAIDGEGKRYNVSLQLEPQNKFPGNDCYQCRIVGGRLVCGFFPCPQLTNRTKIKYEA